MPKRTENDHFDQLQYNLFITTWLPLASPFREKYGLQYSDLRILIAIQAIRELYTWRLNGRGANIRHITQLTGFLHVQVKKRLIKLEAKGFLRDSGDKNRQRPEFNLKLTNKGREVVNLLSGDMDKVNERMVNYLYEKGLLK